MRNKFNAVPTVVDGHRFASGKEARRYGELMLLQRAGEIANLELQPPFPIHINGNPVMIGRRQVVYYADFAYDEGGARVVEDAKGADTHVSKLKRALVEAIYGVKVRIT